MPTKFTANTNREGVLWRTDENGMLLGFRDNRGVDYDIPLVIVSPTAPSNADGLPDGTVWIQTS